MTCTRLQFLRAVCAAAVSAPAILNADTITSPLDIGGADIELSFDPDGFDLKPEIIRAWVSRAARAVTRYYGVFPVSRMRVRVLSSNARTGVFHGTTWGGHPPFTRISVGRHTTEQELAADWMMTHELVHTAFPDVPDEHHWIEEGIATYVEPVARVQTGELTAQKIWTDMVNGMPHGEPQPGDEGLDRTHTWGRTYWGGALFCLVADVRIRQATSNQKGLQHALRDIRNAGGTIESDWPLEKALRIGDQATATNVLTRLYAEMKDKPSPIDLDSLWKQLGVLTGTNPVSFDNNAPLSPIRQSITTAI